MAKKKSSANKPAIRLKKPRNPHPPPPPAEHRFKPGQSGNPGGRPKLLGESYKQWLAKINAEGMTNAEAVAMAIGVKSMQGDVSAARELRAATEGEQVRLLTWQTEIVELLKAGALTPADVVEELGLDDARTILIAAGAALPARVPPEAASGDADRTPPAA